MTALNVTLTAPKGGAAITAIPADCDPRIGELHAHWHAWRPAPGMLPGRQHFNPSVLCDLLRHIWMCDVMVRPYRFRYRLVGTALVQVMGSDPTGSWLEEVHPNFKSSPAFADFVCAADHGAGSYYRGQPLFHISNDYVSLERVMLPLARDGRTVDMLIGLTLYRAPNAPPKSRILT